MSKRSRGRRHEAVKGLWVGDILARAKLRATRQRTALAQLLFSGSCRHVSVDSLFEELVSSGAPGSLSCVYNTLRRFSDIGLIRRVPIYGATAYFDTHLEHHHHFYVVDEDRLIDVPSGAVSLCRVPTAPHGYEIVSVDVLLRVKRSNATATNT